MSQILLIKEVFMKTKITLVASILILIAAQEPVQAGFFARKTGVLRSAWARATANRSFKTVRMAAPLMALFGFYNREQWQKFSVIASPQHPAFTSRDNQIRLVAGPKEPTGDIGHHDNTRTFWGLFNKDNPSGLRCTKYQYNPSPLDEHQFSEKNPHIRDVHVTKEDDKSKGPLEVEFKINMSKCTLKKDPNLPWLNITCGNDLYAFYSVDQVNKIETRPVTSLVTTKEDVTEALKKSR
jgi:hypothetical protein